MQAGAENAGSVWYNDYFATAASSEEQLKTEAARLRKRFQHAKERLRKMAEEAGLLEP